MLELQPNEGRCKGIKQSHILEIANNCPISKNPGKGSKITIMYKPECFHLEVAALRKYVNSYIGGRGDVRSMEGMISQISQDCADKLGVKVTVKADLIIYPEQEMRLICKAEPA